MKLAVRILSCGAILGSLSLPWVAQAQIFVCKDSAGRTLTSDRMIPECANRPMREMDRNGIVRREIPAPLTAEQKQQKQLDEARRKVEADAVAEQKQIDRALLARYRNEADIAMARQRTADIVLEQVKREHTVQQEARARRHELVTKTDAIKDKRRVPPSLQHALTEVDHSIAASEQRSADYQIELTAIRDRFDGALKRYRELKQTTASP